MIAHSPSAPFPKLSPEEYLQWEERQGEKRAYFDGEIYAMLLGDSSTGNWEIVIVKP